MFVCTLRCHAVGVALSLMVCVSASPCQSPDVWRPILHTEALLDSIPGTAFHFSSYARNGGNNDMGQYYGTDPFGWKILCDVTGPGVVTEFWCTRRPWSDTLRLRVFVDNLSQPAIDTTISRLLGETWPFVPPLADSAMAAWFSYVPIAFQSCVRICYRGASLYYHVNGLSLPVGTDVEPFATPPSPSYQSRLDSLFDRLENPQRPAWPDHTPLYAQGTAQLAAGACSTLVSYAGSGGGGAIRKTRLLLSSHSLNTLDNLWVRFFIDGDPIPDLDGPAGALFGAALGWWPYMSSANGISGDTAYLNLPVPFGDHVRIEASNQSTGSVGVTVIAEIVDLSPAERGRYRMHAVCRDENPTRLWQSYELTNLQGPGNFVGVLLDMRPGESGVYEGDERIFLNGETTASWCGTGTEDYFNAGYYWDTWQDYQALPLHGCIHYSWPSCAVYRWHLTGTVPFSSRFRMDIEVGSFNQLTAHYRSVAFCYALPAPWSVSDNSGNGQSEAGEDVRIIGRRLIPGATLAEIRLGNRGLEIVDGSTVVNADSIVDVTVSADADSSGECPLLAMIGGQCDTACCAWRHSVCPTLTYDPVRHDIDTLVFRRDSLWIRMDGASPGSVWTLSAGGRSLPWATGIGTADSAGHVAGYVLVADSLSFGDHAIAACSPGYPNGECTQPLRHRSFARFETEDLNVVGHQGSWRGAKYAPDWLPPGSTEQWGRNIAAVLEGSGTSSYVEYRFYAPTMTTCRVRYMMGGTMTGAVIRSKVNGDTDLDSYDTYRSTGYWWTRLDTVNGQWRSLTGGPQTLRIEVTGRHPSSSGWTVISDQIIIESSPDGVVGKPRSPADLTASLSDSGIRLVWSAVREDETGNPLVPAGYLVLSCLGMDSADELIGTVSGNDTTFLDERPFPVAQLPVIYFVIAESDSGGLPISSPSTPGHPRQHKKRSAPVGSALPLR